MANVEKNELETCRPGSKSSTPPKGSGFLGLHGRHLVKPPTGKTGLSTGIHTRTPSFLAQFIAGGFGGVGSILAGHPLDTVKVRLQTQPMQEGKPLLYRGTWHCATKIIKHEGIRGLFKGMLVPIMVVSPRLAIAFWSYKVGKQLQTPQGNTEGEFAPHQLFLAGALSGLFAATFMIPSERIKCLLQVQDVTSAGRKYTNSFDCAKQIYNKAGIFRGIYRGTFVTLLRDVPYAGMYFMTYEQLKKAFSRMGPRNHDGWMVVQVIFAGGTAGVMSWSIAIAPDTIKSIIQSEPAGATPSSMRTVFRDLMRKDGPRAFFTGLAPSLLRAFPANAACFGAYEMSMLVLTWCGV